MPTCSWMEETEERQRQSERIEPEVRSIMVLAMNYGPDTNPLAILDKKDRAAISVYAQNRDYHDIIMGKFKHRCRPLFRPRRAGREGLCGYCARHGKAVGRSRRPRLAGQAHQSGEPELGSWLFLGSIFTTAQIPPDEPDHDHCGSCHVWRLDIWSDWRLSGPLPG